MDRFKSYRFPAWSKPVCSRRSASFSLIIFATALLALSGWNRTGEESSAYRTAYNTSGLANVTLTDQYGQQLPLAALKGKPVLFDFIYTSCPGPCQLLTQHMKLIADKLGRPWVRKFRLCRLRLILSMIAQAGYSTMREHSTPIGRVGISSQVRPCK